MEPTPEAGASASSESAEACWDPEEALEKCSGRTATTLISKGTSGTARGTEVSRSVWRIRVARPRGVSPNESPTGSGCFQVVPSPSGGGANLVSVGRKERLRGVNRFAGRLLGAVSASRSGISSRRSCFHELVGMLHDRNTAPVYVAKLLHLHPPRKRAILLALDHTPDPARSRVGG